MADELPTAAAIEAKAKDAGLSIAEVCRKANVAQSTFSRWKAGKTTPTFGVCQRILDAMRGAA